MATNYDLPDGLYAYQILEQITSLCKNPTTDSFYGEFIQDLTREELQSLCVNILATLEKEEEE
jgi:hypothetical protein